VATYYIDHDGGNDGSDGLSTGAAKLHIPALSAGDTVKFKLGIVYPHVYTTIAANCTFTVESGWGSGQAVWGDNSLSDDWLLLIEHSGTTVTGLTSSYELKFTGTGLYRGAIGILPRLGDISGSHVHYVEIKDISSNGDEEGIGIKAGVGDYDNAVTLFDFSNNLIHDCWSFAIKVSGGVAALSGIIHHNDIHANGARRAVDAVADCNVNISSNETTSCDISIYNNDIYSPSHSMCYNLAVNMVGVKVYLNNIYSAGLAGIGTHAEYNTTMTGIIDIYRNKIYSNGEEGVVVGPASSTRYVKISNNLIYNNHTNGYQIRTINDGDYTQIYFNTIYTDSGTAGGIRQFGTSTDTDIRNNIISVNKYFCIVLDTTTGVTEDYNVLHAQAGATGTISGAVAGAHDVISDPLMTNPTTDFTIPTGSPAKDAGINVGVTDDYLGYGRPAGAGYDIGAYEYGASAGSFSYVRIY
jgi:hypothetical protein